ncbi:MAG: hypothetical protein P8J27_02005 [Mariniblastus sp.]|nr:hypothetical protein [Mariniblastus sp.]
METVYRDYRNKDVQFFYVYKSVEHPEINGYVSAFNIEERIKHIEIAKTRFKSEIPWICDTMDNAVKNAFGKAPNGEFVIDPQGKIVRKRFWSNPVTLRRDLEELVGKSKTTTTVDDLPAVFMPETRKIASGVVPKLDLPKGLMPLRIQPQADEENPFFAKLRVEASRQLFTNKEGQMLFSVYLDPIYKVHWNNRAGKVKIEFVTDGSMTFQKTELLSKEVLEDADIDPRQFLVNAVANVDKEEPTPLRVTVTYTVCDDAETFCREVSQKYIVMFQPTRDLGSRPGIFLNSMFADVRDFDKNGDGNLTADELPEGKVTLYVGHMDYNGNEIIEKDEIDRFMKMFNNGAGVDAYDDGGKPDEGHKDLEDEPKGE